MSGLPPTPASPYAPGAHRPADQQVKHRNGAVDASGTAGVVGLGVDDDSDDAQLVKAFPGAIDLNSPQSRTSGLPQLVSGEQPSTGRLSSSSTKSTSSSPHVSSLSQSPNPPGSYPQPSPVVPERFIDRTKPASLSIPSSSSSRCESSRSSNPSESSLRPGTMIPQRPVSPILHSPLGDFQSDDVLNAPSRPPLAGPAPSHRHGSPNFPDRNIVQAGSTPTSPISGPVAHVGPPPSSFNLDLGPSGSPAPMDTTAEGFGSSPIHPQAYPQPGQPSHHPTTPRRTRHERQPSTGGGGGGSSLRRKKTLSSAVHIPTSRPRNPFAPPQGTEQWTRESWSKRKVALISGITGQDGSYLTEILLERGYTVHGIIRRSSSFNTSRLHHLFEDQHHPGQHHHQQGDQRGDGSAASGEDGDESGAREQPRPRMILHYGDLTDSTNLVYIISQVQPSEIYNLGAQSHVKVSFEMAEYTGDVDGLGTLRLLDAVRTCGLDQLVRFYQASTSEMYGQVRETPQNEDTPFYPRSPYGCAKLYAYWTVVNYREAYGMFASNGILFNHESPRRGRTFVTRKITRAVAEISLGKQECMFMGNLDAMRDWGHARDYCDGMWRILQHDKPTDWVLASGETHSVREFIERSFAVVGMRISWRGEGVDEVGVEETSGKVLVRVDPKYFRPSEVDHLLGDASKAESLLGWKRTTGFRELITEMVLSDLESAKYLVEDHN